MEKVNTLSVSQGRGIIGAGKSKILPLTAMQVHDVIESFRESLQRQRVCAQIEGQLNKYGLNLGKAYSATEVEKVIRDAIEIGLGGEDSWKTLVRG